MKKYLGSQYLNSNTKDQFKLLNLKNKNQLINNDGEFDELNHEIYEFIHQCLNTDDSDLIFPILEDHNQNKTLLIDPNNVSLNLSNNNNLKLDLNDILLNNDDENDPNQLNNKENVHVPFENTFDINNIMLRAAFLGKTDILKSCLENGADVLYTDKVGRKALHYAAACGWLPTIQLLVKFDSDINKRDYKNWTALHISVSKKYPDIVELLLSSGADLNLDLPHTCAPCRGGPISSKAIHFAAIKGHSKITELLLRYGANINDKDQDNKTPLHYASFRSNIEYVKWLIDRGADVNSKDKYGRIPLHVASLSGNIEMAKILVKAGSLIDIKDIWDMSPLILAKTREHVNMTLYLESISKEKGSIFNYRGFELDPLESIVLNTIVTGLKEPKKEFLARVVKTIGSKRSLQLFENTMRIENEGGLKTADGSRRKAIGGVFCYLLKKLFMENEISMDEWNYIRQEDKERINAKNILKRNNRRSQV